MGAEQPGLNERSSTARTSDASLSAESSPLMSTWGPRESFSFSKICTQVTLQCFELSASARRLTRSKGRRVNTVIGVGMLTGLQTALFSEQDGNGSVCCPCDYYVCQLWAKPEYLSEQNQAWFGLVQLYFQYLDVWVEFVRMVHSVTDFRACHFSFMPAGGSASLMQT